MFLAAAKVGGIAANDASPAEFIYDNLVIQTNVIHSAWKNGTSKLLFLGSSCVYPKFASQPAKRRISLDKRARTHERMVRDRQDRGNQACGSIPKQYGFNAISASAGPIFTGPGIIFDLYSSHVLPALLRKFSEARERGTPEVVVWGTGDPRREFLHVDDLANAALFLMKYYEEDGIINIGTGTDVTIPRIVGSGETDHELRRPDNFRRR